MKKTRRLVTAALALAVIAAPVSCRRQAPREEATIVESTESIKTYPFSDPDPVPIFARSSMWGRGTALYPYFFFTDFSTRGIDKEWTVVRLENPFIRVAVLPQVGGKVWGAADKRTGGDFLYTNRVLKFREIALRGPWTSGGIEFNFGVVGHGPSTATPVDYAVRRNADGSVSCVVGALDLPSRTRWSVAVTLPKDKAYFETNPRWYNPSPFSQSYYAWMCAAVKTADDLRYIFPGNHHIGHDYSVPLEPWPVDAQGRDLAEYENNDTPGSKSYFTVGEYEDFYGGWYEGSDSGFGHWARYDDVPGRKIWIWDQSRQGEIWVDLLTDADGQYTEPQAGRLLNQSDHEFFRPYAADFWKEIWFPYSGIGPMVKASPSGVLNVTPRDGSLSVAVFPLEAVTGDLVVRARGKDIFRQPVALKTGEPFKKDIPLAEGFEDVEVRVGDRLFYRSAPQANDLTRLPHFGNSDESTAEGLFLRGTRLEKEREYGAALEKYGACLEREPEHVRALSRTAEIHCRRGEYEKALDYAGRALDAAMYDPEANFVYGVIARRLSRTVDAKEALGWAARSGEYRSAAYCQMAEIFLQEKDYESALEYGRRALDADMHSLNALEVMATAYRKKGMSREARETLEKILETDPLDHLARFELYLLKPENSSLKDFTSMIRCEIPHEVYLETAMYYVRLGLTADAVAVLKNIPEHPTACYWLAYLLKDASAEESQGYLEKASGMSAWLVFPFREESIPVFEWAVSARPSDWKPKYYLGLILWGKGRVDESLRLFESCRESDFAPFFLARGSLYQDRAPEKARADFETAVRIDDKSWRNWHLLAGFLLRAGLTDEALKCSRQAAERFPDEVPVVIDLVKSLMKAGQYAEAAALLDRVEALPYEGASEIQGLYEDSHIRLALAFLDQARWDGALDELEKSKAYPERLGTGAPFNPDVRLQDYLQALCYEKMGEKEKAEEKRNAVLDYTLKNWKNRGPNAYFGGLVLRKIGEQEKARELTDPGFPSKEILGVIKKLEK